MTTVGKLLVFMNLVFSLVVGAFAVMDYTARTHWSEAYKKLESQYAVAAGTASAYKAEADRLTKQQADLNEKLASSGDKELRVEKPEDAGRVAAKAAALLNERGTTIDELKKQLITRSQEVTDLKAALAKSSATSMVAVADVGRRQEDTAKLVTQLNDERNKNNSLVLEKNKLRDEKTAAEIDRNAFKARSEQLASDNLRLEKLNAALKAAGGAAATVKIGATPPPADVEGLVQKAEGNLVTISIGSDAGIQRDHVLQVFRLGNNPKYVGRIRIVEVTPKNAVGQAVGRTNGAMQVDDRVATKILGGGN